MRRAQKGIFSVNQSKKIEVLFKGALVDMCFRSRCFSSMVIISQALLLDVFRKPTPVGKVSVNVVEVSKSSRGF